MPDQKAMGKEEAEQQVVENEGRKVEIFNKRKLLPATTRHSTIVMTTRQLFPAQQHHAVAAFEITQVKCLVDWNNNRRIA